MNGHAKDPVHMHARTHARTRTQTRFEDADKQSKLDALDVAQLESERRCV